MSGVQPGPSTHSNAFAVAGALSAFAVATTARARRVVRHHALLLETRIKANASLPAGGPPGPRAITGDYRSSWTHEIVDSGNEITAVIGTNRPQGRRLEYGFVGQDRRGRRYNQPPYPHVGPAVDETVPTFLADMRDALREKP